LRGEARMNGVRWQLWFALVMAVLLFLAARA
jgi:hypothetical protein